jgi:hypothetical protein
MGAGKPAGTGGQQVRIVVRSDILAAAERDGLDIGDVCNRALAGCLGIAYPPGPHKTKAPGDRIVQPAVPSRTAQPPAPPSPVINAEDPTVPGKVIKERKEKKAAPAVKPQPAPVPAPETPQKAPQPATPAPVSKGKKAARPVKKEDAIKKFVGTRVVRETEESPEAIVAKDELYERFGRWCRDHEYATVPDRRAFTVALKNKYAFGERTVGGVPSWCGIRIK